MRRFLRFSVLCLALGAANACKPEEVFITEDIPTAGIRFLNVVPDTGAVDFRPVDIVENSTFYAMAHRSTGLFYYKNARAGARHFRIFMSPDYRSFPQRKDFILPDDAADSPAAGVVPLERPETWELGRFREQATHSSAPHPHNPDGNGAAPGAAPEAGETDADKSRPR